jgi:hypothetical protein
MIKITKRKIFRRKVTEFASTVFDVTAEWFSTTKKNRAQGESRTVIRVTKPRTDACGHEELCITSPPDGARVPERPFVQGRVTNTRARVWVVIHPMEWSDYWVQPPTTVHQNGTWKVQVYVGRPGVLDVGKHFEIMACANVHGRVEEGTVLSWWPDADYQSNAIEVVRE